MSVSLAAERDRLQRQIEELEQSLARANPDLDLLSTDTSSDDGSDQDDFQREPAEVQVPGLLAQRDRIQREIEEIETALGSETAVCLSDDDSSASEESAGELDLPLTADSCLQINLVYQQVLQDTLQQLSSLLYHNRLQQKEVLSHMSGSIRESSREQLHPSDQHPIKMYLGHFLKPYFKDKLTGLGPPANQETKDRVSKMTASLDDKWLKMKRWEGWQKTLLIHAVARDSQRRQLQPKQSRHSYLCQKLRSAGETKQTVLRQQIDQLEEDIKLINAKMEEELLGERYDDHDWQRISNIDFEGTREAEDLRKFWQNFLHPSINRSGWRKEEVQHLEQISRQHKERDWEAITQELGTGRTPFMCLQTFQRFVSKTFKRRAWCPAEDALLRELVKKMRIGNFIPYTQMSYFMEGREPPQLLYRWTSVLDPSIKKGFWSREEDEMLLRAVERYGEKNWWRIRLEVPGRTDGACRDRYHDCLRAGIKRGAFDEEERDLLLQLIKKHGVGHWARIAAEIPNRYDAQCMREWRKISGSNCKSRSNYVGKAARKMRCQDIRRLKRHLVKLEKEESSEEESTEEEQVEYMDSDKEEEERKDEVSEDEDYVPNPIETWVPVEKKSQAGSLSWVFVAPPLPCPDQQGVPVVRCTVLDQFGCHLETVVSPSPRVLGHREQHHPQAMLSISSSQLCSIFLRRAKDVLGKRDQHLATACTKRQKGFLSKKRQPIKVNSLSLHYELFAALMPWIGNVLIPVWPRSKAILADTLRQRGEQEQLLSTPLFQLFLQVLNVDLIGCKGMIQNRRKGLSPPSPSPSLYRPPKAVNLKMVAGHLEQCRDLQLGRNKSRLLTPQQLYPQQAKLPLMPQQPRPLIQIQQPRPLIQVQQPRPLIQVQQPQQLLQLQCQPQGRQLTLQPVLQVQQQKQLILQQPQPLIEVQQYPHQLILQLQPTPQQNQQQQLVLQVQPSTLLQQTQHTQPQQKPQQTQPQQKGQKRKSQQQKQPRHVKKKNAPPPPLTLLSKVAPNFLPGMPPTLHPQMSPLSFPHQTLFIRKPVLPPLQPLAVSEQQRQTSRATPPPAVGSSFLPSPHHPTAPASIEVVLPPVSDSSLANQPIGSSHCMGRKGGQSQSLENLSDQQNSVGGAFVRKEGKRVLKLSQKAKALQEATETKAEAMRNKSSSRPCQKKNYSSLEKPIGQTKQIGPPPGILLAPGQSMWIPAPSGLVPLAGAPSQGVHLARHGALPVNAFIHQIAPPPPRLSMNTPPVLTNPPFSVSNISGPITRPPTVTPTPTQPPSITTSSTQPPTVIPTSTQPPPITPTSTQPPPICPSSTQLLGVGLSSSTQHPPFPLLFSTGIKPPTAASLHLPSHFMPYKGTITVDPRVPPPLRKEILQFDPALLFPEERKEVQQWLSGHGGVEVPGLQVALPYLPPFVSSLRTLCALLQAKKSLTDSALQLLSHNRYSKHISKPNPASGQNADPAPSQEPDLTPGLEPDSNPDNNNTLSSRQPSVPGTDSSTSIPAENGHTQPGLSSEPTEAESVAAIRRLVAERFVANPAYQMLKARFLSCFTLPALLASIQPVTAQPEACSVDGEDSGQKREESSRLLSEGPGPPATYYSGIIRGNPSQAQTSPDQ
ncbi:snRNA-activating protein complex subunit 4 isoform X2 [Lampris incognitus]|uniref:snRNA-activating protein complex subunit 4 isoform X2 n=1 Tax=Lampris incognitus TaxID=2546036 RepID=UPI0024B4FE2A|nr:snRNA-activating protein complex subunit 4 isoform X2 [Lampris incognitus]